MKWFLTKMHKQQRPTLMLHHCIKYNTICTIIVVTIIVLCYGGLAYGSSSSSSSSSGSSSTVIGNEENGPLSEVQTAVDLEASLPCDLIPSHTQVTNMYALLTLDKVQLVIWYKENYDKPIYTFDARDKPIQQGIHWADEKVLKSKSALFHYDSSPPALRLTGVRRDDAGLYRCRVDYQKSPTKNSRINLTVLIPPTHIMVLDDDSTVRNDHKIGPYPVDATVNVSCVATGGDPPPRVSWWRQQTLLDDSFQIMHDNTVRNVLFLTRIQRKDLGAVFTCQATNGYVMPPLSVSVTLEMTLEPLFVTLHGLDTVLISGVRTQLTCISTGARPSPDVLWHKGVVQLRGATQSTSDDGNITVSEFIFIPAPEDNGRTIGCSVASTGGGGGGVRLKDSRVLDVRHAPIVTLSLGAPLDADRLLMGTDVYLECVVQANPAARKVEWFHQDSQLHISRKVIISNQTLVLQAITKTSHGRYSCRASNTQGAVASNDVYLDVKYPPVCRTESRVIHAAVHQTLAIECDVDANPSANLTYRWQFNNTIESVIDLPPPLLPSLLPVAVVQQSSHDNSIVIHSHHLHTHSHSHPHYGTRHTNDPKRTPPTDPGRVYSYELSSFHRFGTVTCYASNPIGHSSGCMYHVTVAENPDPVENCTASNATANTLHIVCVAGRDGGIPLQYLVEITDVTNNNFEPFNTTYRHSDFMLRRLPSATEFVVRVLAFNAQGPSLWYRFNAATLPAPLLRTASSTAGLNQLTPILGVIIGICGTLIVCISCVLLFIRARKWQSQRPIIVSATPIVQPPIVGKHNIGGNTMVTQFVDTTLDDRNPDVIPADINSDDEELASEEKAFDRLLRLETERLCQYPIGGKNGHMMNVSVTPPPTYAIYNSPPYHRPLYVAAVGRMAGNETTLPTYFNNCRSTSPNTTVTIPLLAHSLYDTKS